MVVRARLRVSKMVFSSNIIIFLIIFDHFKHETVRTGTRRFDFRNQRHSIHIPTFHLFPDRLRRRVNRTFRLNIFDPVSSDLRGRRMDRRDAGEFCGNN